MLSVSTRVTNFVIMVLLDLGKSINGALQKLLAQPQVDEKVLDDLLKDVCRALLESDVNVKLVQQLRNNVKKNVNINALAAGMNKKRIIQRSVFDELCKLVDPGVTPYKPVKGKSNVLLMVGLQGSGKTTTCTKIAHYYSKKGWKVGLVCADTFRAGAFDQLKQNAAKAKIPFYGSYSEADPVKIVAEGVEMFKKEHFEIIIVDTSGRHKQEGELFQEMKDIAKVAQPDEVIFVMDASIGQAAEGQASAFKSAVPVGSIVLTKMDGHAKGGGAISAIAVTQSPIIFIGTGEHMYDLESFQSRPFVSKMLGMGDISGLLETVKDVSSDPSQQQKQQEMMKRMSEGQFSLRDLYEQLQMMLNMGPISKVMSMMPGFNSEMFKGSEGEISTRLKLYMTCMDSMTDEELDSDGKAFTSQPSRMIRVARGSGNKSEVIEELLQHYKKFAQLIKKMGAKGGLFKNLAGASSVMGGGPGAAGGNSRNMARMNQQMASMMPPGLLDQMGGLGGMMRQFSSGGFGDMLAGMGGGAGDMPDLSALNAASGKRKSRK